MNSMFKLVGMAKTTKAIIYTVCDHECERLTMVPDPDLSPNWDMNNKIWAAAQIVNPMILILISNDRTHRLLPIVV